MIKIQAERLGFFLLFREFGSIVLFIDKRFFVWYNDGKVTDWEV